MNRNTLTQTQHTQIQKKKNVNKNILTEIYILYLMRR